MKCREYTSSGLCYKYITIVIVMSDVCTINVSYIALARVINYAPRMMLQIVASFMIVLYNHNIFIVQAMEHLKMAGNFF